MIGARPPGHGVGIAAATLLGLLSVAAFSGADGRAPALTPARHGDGPPPGHTGGFGEPTCLACHTGSDANEPGGALLVEGLPERFEPGRAYGLRVVLESGEMGVAGFQGAFRFRSGAKEGVGAGTPASVDGRVAVVTDERTGTRYVQHTRLGTAVETADLSSWSFEWTAPEVAADVIFDVAANSGNGDDSPLGDLVYQASFRIAATPQNAGARHRDSTPE